MRKKMKNRADKKEVFSKNKELTAKTAKLTAILLVVILVAGFAQAAVPKFPQIAITMINHEPDPVAPGEVTEVKFRIENEGSDPAYETQVKVVPEYPFSIYGGEDTKEAGTLAGYQTGNVGVREEWKLLVDKEASTGENPVEVWYKIKGGVWTRAGEYNITVRSRESELAINEIRTAEENIVPGTKTQVAFVLENLADSTLYDIKLELDVLTQITTSTSVEYRELPFTPIGSGDEKTLKNLGPGETKEISFILFTDADAESEAYKVPYSLSYYDASGTQFNKSGVLGLIVEAIPDLSANLESTEIYTAGKKGKIKIKMVNKGFSDIKFLDATLNSGDGYEVISNPEVYIGELDSDDYETAEYTLLVSNQAQDQLTLPFRVEYRDANGKLYTSEVPLTLRLFSGSELKLRTNGGGFPWGVVIIIIIIAVVVYIYIRKRKKKERQRKG